MKVVIDIKALTHVALKLQPLDENFAFIGGAVIPLLLEEPLVTTIRPTKDIDIIIEVVSRLDFARLEERLRAIGFKHDMSEGAPKCRWIVDGIKVDVMPVSGEAAEWRSKWFPEALAAAEEIELDEKVIANVVTAPFFIATKLEAFFDRGNKDFYASADLEDIITILDGRSSILRKIYNLPRSLRSYLSEQFTELIRDPDFIECLPGHLLPDTASQERLPQLLDTLHHLAVI
ncbi:MAG: nucleotidyl transferase AbiEii/AbiGii toxin family protein [Candidatus Auribacterota bacterium]|nr:nucleotidyl transferase AbiEii/AbiGii toxin family protein [Candidatus Auribacterota bacterium]